MEFKDIDEDYILIKSDSGRTYQIDKKMLTCTCTGFSVHGYKIEGFECKHIKEYKKYGEGKK